MYCWYMYSNFTKRPQCSTIRYQAFSTFPRRPRTDTCTKGLSVGITEIMAIKKKKKKVRRTRDIIDFSGQNVQVFIGSVLLRLWRDNILKIRIIRSRKWSHCVFSLKLARALKIKRSQRVAIVVVHHFSNSVAYNI